MRALLRFVSQSKMGEWSSCRFKITAVEFVSVHFGCYDAHVLNYFVENRFTDSSWTIHDVEAVHILGLIASDNVWLSRRSIGIYVACCSSYGRHKNKNGQLCLEVSLLWFEVYLMRAPMFYWQSVLFGWETDASQSWSDSRSKTMRWKWWYNHYCA